MNFMFSAMSAVFPVLFIAVLGIIIVSMARGVTQWSHNNAQPRVPARARVVGKHTNVSHHHHNHGDVHTAHTTTDTTYYVTFEYETGDRVVLRVPRQEYGMMAEGDDGTLTAQGTRFIGFERMR